MSLIGLVIQLAMAVVLLIYGYLFRDVAALTASGLAGTGVVVWLSLAIVFDQHRRERVEALEADTLAGDATSASVFDDSSGDLRVAGKRLDSIHRFFIPTVSILVGATLLGLGIWRLGAASGLASEPITDWMPRYSSSIALAIGLSIGFVGFIFARYVSGMATQTVWANLRGGAAFAVASSLYGITMAVGAFAEIAGQDVVLRYLPAAFAISQIVLGAEVFLNFLLNLYRPRKAGEMPRPGFDSRILAFVAAPDRIAESVSEAINYQFGFDVTGSWFYQLLSKVFLPIVIFGVVVVWMLSSIVVLEPHQRGLVLRWGAIRGDTIGPGLHIKAPWPIDRVLIPEFIETDTLGRTIARERTAEGIRTIGAGSNSPTDDNKPILWTEQHAENEVFMVCQPARSTSAGTVAVDVTRRPGDLALIAAEVPVIYTIDNVLLYEQLGLPGVRDELLTSVARREVMLFFMTMSVDEILGTERMAISGELFGRIERAFAGLNPGDDGVPRGAGVKLLWVGAEGVHPPRATAPNFEGVVKAMHSRESIIHKAQTEAVIELTSVVGSVELAEQIADEIERVEQMQVDGADDADIREQELLIEGLLADAGGEAAATILDARAGRWITHLGAKRRMTEHAGFMAAFEAMPRLFMADMYFDAVLDAMADARVYIVDARKELRIDLDLQTKDAQMDVFNSDPEIDG